MVTKSLRPLFLVCFFSLLSNLASAQPEKTIRVFRGNDTFPSSIGGLQPDRKYDRYMFAISPLTIVTGELPVFGEYVFARNFSAGLGIGPTFNAYLPLRYTSTGFDEIFGFEKIPERGFTLRDNNSTRDLGITFRPSINFYFDEFFIPIPLKITAEYRYRRYNYTFTPPEPQSINTVYGLSDNFHDWFLTFSYIRQLGSSGNFFLDYYTGFGYRTLSAEVVNDVSQNPDQVDYQISTGKENAFLTSIGFKLMYFLEKERKPEKLPALPKKAPVKKKGGK